MFYRKYQRSLRLKACGFSQRAKRSAWKMRQQGAKRVGAPKVRCGFSPASAGVENATAGSEASRSTEGALSQRIHELRKFPCESSPASAGSELTAQVCWPVIRLCNFGRRNYTTGHHAAGHGSCCGKSLLCCERPWSSLWHHLSICFMAFPISASIQIERRRISAGAPVSPRLMHAYTASRFCAVIFQKGYLIITGVLPPTPSSR